MSYKRTVYCRYCGEAGHNARTCPSKTRHIKERAEYEVAQGEGRDGYWHKQYAKRTGEWLDGGDATLLKKSTRRQTTRRCKYCKKTGHNQATCPELKTAKESYIDGVKLARKGVWENMQRLGLGVGALVRMPTYSWQSADEAGAIWMVKSVNWGSINHENLASGDSNVLTLERVSSRSKVNQWNLTTGAGFLKLEGLAPQCEQHRSHEYTIVGPVPNPVGPTEEVLNAEDINLKGVFADRESPNAYENRWND